MSLYSVPQYNYTKRPDGTEVGTLKEYPIWMNPDRLLELNPTTNSEESSWWKVSFEGGSRFYTDFETARAINDPERILPNPIAERPTTVYPQVNCYQYTVNQSTGRVSARLLSDKKFVSNFSISVGVVSVEQLDATYWKVRMSDGTLYYTDRSGAEAFGIERELQQPE